MQNDSLYYTVSFMSLEKSVYRGKLTVDDYCLDYMQFSAVLFIKKSEFIVITVISVTKEGLTDSS